MAVRRPLQDAASASNEQSEDPVNPLKRQRSEVVTEYPGGRKSKVNELQNEHDSSTTAHPCHTTPSSTGPRGDPVASTSVPHIPVHPSVPVSASRDQDGAREACERRREGEGVDAMSTGQIIVVHRKAADAHFHARRFPEASAAYTKVQSATHTHAHAMYYARTCTPSHPTPEPSVTHAATRPPPAQ